MQSSEGLQIIYIFICTQMHTICPIHIFHLILKKICSTWLSLIHTHTQTHTYSTLSHTYSTVRASL